MILGICFQLVLIANFQPFKNWKIYLRYIPSNFAYSVNHQSYWWWSLQLWSLYLDCLCWDLIQFKVFGFQTLASKWNAESKSLLAYLYNNTICCTINESSIFLFSFRGFSFDGPYLCKFVENIPKINVVMPQIEMVEIVETPSEIKTRNLNSMTRLRFWWSKVRNSEFTIKHLWKWKLFQ